MSPRPDCGPRSVLERAQRAVSLDGHHGLGRPRRLVAAHARGVAGHAGQREADDVVAIREESFDCGQRDVSFEYVAGNDGRVARRGFVRDAEVESASTPLRIVFDSDVDASFCQVPDPARTAPSTGVAPHLDRLAVEDPHRSRALR